MRQLKITKQITNRASKSLDKYLQDISKLPMITADEEVELAHATFWIDEHKQDSRIDKENHAQMTCVSKNESSFAKDQSKYSTFSESFKEAKFSKSNERVLPVPGI